MLTGVGIWHPNRLACYNILHILSMKFKTNTHNGAQLSTEYMYILIGMNESSILSESFYFFIVNGISTFHGL